MGTFGGDNGPATSAHLYNPAGVAVDSAGNIYIADTYNNRIREVSNGVIITVAGNGTSGFTGTSLSDNGPATSAQLQRPRGVTVDSAGNLYIAALDLSDPPTCLWPELVPVPRFQKRIDRVLCGEDFAKTLLQEGQLP